MMYKYHTYSFVCIIIVVQAVPINHEGLCWKRYSEDKRLSLSSLKGVIIFCILKLLRPRAKTNDIIFNIYLNDLPDVFDDSCCPVKLQGISISLLQYADDIILLSESEEGLQKCIDRLNDYFNKWKLNISKTKTKIMEN